MTYPPPGIFGWNYGTGGTHFFRIEEPLRGAFIEGVRCHFGKTLDDDIASQYDTVLVHSLNDSKGSEAWKKLATNGKHRMVIDVDDAMWWADWGPFKAAWNPDRLARLYQNVQLAHVVTTPSPVIAEYLSRINPNVHIAPNTVPSWLLHQVNRGPRARVLAYQGSPSHIVDMSPELVQALKRFLADHEWWEVWQYGGDSNQVEGRERFRIVPWKASLREYYKSVYMDVGLGPLADTLFNRAKSSLRAIEYAALGIPGVFTHLPIYDDYVINGKTGILVPPGGDWYEPLRYLAQDHDERRAMSIRARLEARNWTTERNIGKWLTAWNSV